MNLSHIKAWAHVTEQTGGRCTNTAGSFVCTCKEGYIRDGDDCDDVDECKNHDDNSCADIAFCQNELGSFSCKCPDGFIGDGERCTEVDECNPLSVFPHSCDANARCENEDGSFTCTCKEGFVGDGETCYDEDECAVPAKLSCDKEHGTCVNAEGSYSCGCKVTCMAINVETSGY